MKYLCRINYRVEVYTTCSWDIAVKHHTIFQFASIETRHSVTFRGKWSLISMLQDFLGEFWLLQRWNVNLILQSRFSWRIWLLQRWNVNLILQSIFTLSFNLCTVTPVHIQLFQFTLSDQSLKPIWQDQSGIWDLNLFLLLFVKTRKAILIVFSASMSISRWQPQKPKINSNLPIPPFSLVPYPWSFDPTT